MLLICGRGIDSKQSILFPAGYEIDIRMKTFLWLLVLACVVWSVCCWAVSHVIVIVLTGISSYDFFMWPGMTKFLLCPNGWIFLFPLPWCIYAIMLSFRRELTPRDLFVFAGTVVLGLTILTCAIAVACALPYVFLFGHLEP